MGTCENIIAEAKCEWIVQYSSFNNRTCSWLVKCKNLRSNLCNIAVCNLNAYFQDVARKRIGAPTFDKQAFTK